MGSVNNLTENLNHLFSATNVDNLSKTLSHIEQISGTIAMQRNDLAETLHQLNTLTKQADNTMHDLSRLALHTDALFEQRRISNADCGDRLAYRFGKSDAAY